MILNLIVLGGTEIFALDVLNRSRDYDDIVVGLIIIKVRVLKFLSITEDVVISIIFDIERYF